VILGDRSHIVDGGMSWGHLNTLWESTVSMPSNLCWFTQTEKKI